MSTHYVRFTRHAVTGETRATCTCGWSYCGDRETTHVCAEHHQAKGEVDQTPVRELAKGFVSGLE